MWKENAKEIGRLSLETEESSLGRDLARSVPQGGGGLYLARRAGVTARPHGGNHARKQGCPWGLGIPGGPWDVLWGP